jgi:hypothetical protein
MSDDAGYIERFRREEAFDMAYLPHTDFERELAVLVSEGLVEELDKTGRSARRFRVRDLSRKAEAVAYIAANQPTVNALAAARTRIEPGRSFIALNHEPSALLRIVRVVPLDVEVPADGRTSPGSANPTTATRFGLTIVVAGFGTFYGWVYHELEGKGPVVFPPSRRTGQNRFQKIIDPTSDFAEAVLLLAVETVATYKRNAAAERERAGASSATASA